MPLVIPISELFGCAECQRLNAFTIIDGFISVYSVLKKDPQFTLSTASHLARGYIHCCSTRGTISTICNENYADIFCLHIMYTALVERVLAFYIPVPGCLFWL